MIEVRVKRDCDLSAAIVYALLADFANTSWMNGVVKTEVDGDGVGMVRSIYASADGPPVRERMTARDDAARKVAYTITEGNPLPVKNYNASATVTAVGNHCQIEWAGTFEANGVDDATARATVEGMYGVLIDWLLTGAANA